MRTNWKLLLTVLLTCSALAGGCGGANDRPDTREADAASTPSGTIALTGCVELSPGSGSEFALNNVHLVPPAQQPSATATSASGSPITEGSWVRLAMNDPDELQKHIGQKVSVTGTLREDGRSTIGTSGQGKAPQEPEPAADKSRAGASEHHSEKVKKEAGPLGQDSMANGNAPQVRVQKIEGTGERCNPGLRPERR